MSVLKELHPNHFHFVGSQQGLLDVHHREFLSPIFWHVLFVPLASLQGRHLLTVIARIVAEDSPMPDSKR